MNPENERILAAWLREASKSVTITHSRSGPIDSRHYRQMVRRYRSTYEPTLQLQVYPYEVLIQDAAIGEAILNLLRNELKEFICDDKTLSASFDIVGGIGQSPIQDIMKNLAKEAIVEGPESAAKALYTSIARGHMVFQNYYLLSGIKVEREIQVLDGISLIPLPNSTADLPLRWTPLLRQHEG